jgi:hypothetical protein
MYETNFLAIACSSANIIVPIQLRDLTVAFAVPYYIGVRQQEELVVALPHHTTASLGVDLFQRAPRY